MSDRKTGRDGSSPAAPAPTPLHVYNGGLLARGRVRRILQLAGWQVRLGLPGPGHTVGVWGHSPTAYRGEAVATRRGASLVRVEDAFLRGLHPRGPRGAEPPIGLLIDRRGVHYDTSGPSDLEHMLATHPLDDPALMARAEAGIARMQAAHLSKYCATDPRLEPPETGYVLVVDQVRGDASVTRGGADAQTFATMLARARADHPDAAIVIKTHPARQAGQRPGYFGARDLDGRTRILSEPLSPWRLLAGAQAVYTVSSGLGFEAILAGLTPHVFGAPFYTGWGLSHDHTGQPLPRRGRRLSAVQLAAAALIEAPVWYDPYRDRLASFEETLEALAAQARAWREDHGGAFATGMSAWKRPHLRRHFGRYGALRFVDPPGRAVDRAAVAAGRKDAMPTPRVLVWANHVDDGLRARAKAAGVPLWAVEDGVLRSRGLGADLVAPLAVVSDDLGIAHDPTRPSRLEHLIAASEALPPEALARARDLTDLITRAGVAKYATKAPGQAPPGADARPALLVAGQVEDDASVLLGAGGVSTNLALLKAARAAHPDAFIAYKPHPDVEAGRRRGAVPPDDLARLADAIWADLPAATALAQASAVWTMTSTLGFEALLRGLPVTCTGAPFYAGWGLTRDLGDPPARRRARPALAGLAHAVLIDYPRYTDPVTGLPCPAEVAVERLITGAIPPASLSGRLWAGGQSLLYALGLGRGQR